MSHSIAVHSGTEITLFVVIFLMLTALWCGAGYALTSDHMLAVQVRRWGTPLLPHVLIMLGLYIIAKTSVLN
jgi:cadmium resistance protein CadD (predicted permease)